MKVTGESDARSCHPPPVISSVSGRHTASVVLWETHKSIFSWLVLPRDLKLDGGRQSAGAMSLKEIIGLDGVELGADGKVRFLVSEILPLVQGPGCRGRELEPKTYLQGQGRFLGAMHRLTPVLCRQKPPSQ